TVLEKNVIEGEKIMAGMPLLKIADLSNLWLVANVYEYEIQKISVGSRAFITFKFFPGKIYEGKVSFIYPTLDEKSRTVKVRIDLPNSGELKPSMFANVTIEGKSIGKTIVVPENSVIRTGLKDFVIISLGNGKFKPHEVKLGIYSDGYYQVLDGLIEGNVVVASAQFMIDAESNLRQVIQKFQSSNSDDGVNKSINRSDEKSSSSKSNENGRLNQSDKTSIVRKGIINLKEIDKNRDGKLWQCTMEWNVISDVNERCPICEMRLTEFSINQVKENLDKHGFKYKE
ncbi:MAG: efflux RND transporter periplasmic adaptor subunit, partial [Ignavibacteria bacterium]|nr:efflux RND transporter periplasmic adaptor subunit [Ignavibacteria bacterium]